MRCSGPVPVMRQTIFNLSPARGGTRCPNARPQSCPFVLVPRISWFEDSVPQRDGVAQVGRGPAAPGAIGFAVTSVVVALLSCVADDDEHDAPTKQETSTAS